MNLLLYGSSGLGRGIYDWITRSNQKKWANILFINDFEPEEMFYGTKRIHFESIKNYFPKGDVEILITVGEPTNREKLYNKVKNAGYHLATYIDETSIISKGAIIGEGTIICPFGIIDSNVTLKSNILVEHGCIIGHDVRIDDNSVISSKSIIGGFSTIGELSYLGLASIIKDRIRIGNSVIVTMGSVVFKDVESGMTVIGNPARVTKGNDKHQVFK